MNAIMETTATPVIFIITIAFLSQSCALDPAIVKQPLTRARIGDAAIWSCDSENLSLQLCLWERLSSAESEASFLLSFNPSNTRPGVYSGVEGFSYTGEGLSKGQCGLKVESVRKKDFGKWQCTLFTETRIYRGNVELVMSDEKPDESSKIANESKTTELNLLRNLKPSEGVARPVSSVGSVTLLIPPDIRDSRQLINTRQQAQQYRESLNVQGRARPIITGTPHNNDNPQEVSLPIAAIVGSQVSEVKVESAHLEIKKSKLQTRLQTF